VGPWPCFAAQGRETAPREKRAIWGRGIAANPGPPGARRLCEKKVQPMSFLCTPRPPRSSSECVPVFVKNRNRGPYWTTLNFSWCLRNQQGGRAHQGKGQGQESGFLPPCGDGGPREMEAPPFSGRPGPRVLFGPALFRPAWNGHPAREGAAAICGGKH